MSEPTLNIVLDFWFKETDPKQWWQKDAAYDQHCRERFGVLLRRAAVCELADWRDQPAGRLAEIILLDQLSRNIYRDTPQAFAQDPLALALAQEARRSGADRELDDNGRYFLYMPFMHSESAQVHQQALQLFQELGNDKVLHYEQRHKAIIDRFGRYPHRNALLGRMSTPEELVFLEQPGSAF